jgi:long-subunit fatty acid transport protein
MKANLRGRWIRVAAGVVFGVSIAAAQFAEDALRFSQLGLGVGARTLGLGATSVGVVDDYSALFLNPAGLAVVRDFEFSVGLSHLSYGNDVSYLGSKTSTSSSATNLNNLGLIYPIPTTRGSLTFAFGFGRVSNYTTTASFGSFNSSNSIIESMIPDVNLWSLSDNDRKNLLDNNIPYQLFLAEIDSAQGRLYSLITGNVNQRATIREGGGLNNWSAGGAIDIARDLSVGFTINIVSGSYTYDREFSETDEQGFLNTAPADLSSFTLEQTVRSNIGGYNAVVGLMYRRQGLLKIGMTVKSPTVYEIDEDFTSVGRSVFDNGDRFRLELSDKTSYDLRTPIVIGAGGSLHVTDWLLLAGDVEYIDWTQMEFFSGNPDLVAENRFIKKIFEPTTNFRGGAEVTLWSLGLRLRGGFVLNPSPYIGDPSSYDQLYYTAGAGLVLDQNVTLNLGYALGTWKTFRDNYYIWYLADVSQTQERVKTHTVNITLSYRF